MINGKAFIIYVDETTVNEDLTTTMAPPLALPSLSDSQTVISINEGKPSIVYTETTVFQDITTTVFVKRHAHHARAHGRH
jgi:hypothetical protein